MNAHPLLWLAAALIATVALTLARRAVAVPEPALHFDQGLGRMLAAILSGILLLLLGCAALFRFGLIWPGLAAASLYATSRLATRRDLSPHYAKIYPLTALALLSALLVFLSPATGRP